MILPRKTLERKLLANGYGMVIAVDEVGMGCLAGPVVACAVLLTPEFYKKYPRTLAGLRDSKLLNHKQRENYSRILENTRIVYAVASESPGMIDKLNILQASHLAMRRAVSKLGKSQRKKTIVLVDGNKRIGGLNFEQRAIVKGDRKVFAIACASIIAKVHRDKLMANYARKYPGYGFEVHKGYGTSMHYKKIKELGISKIHRKSFRLD